MKKLLLALIVCFVTSMNVNAQTSPLNKQQTLDYINHLYKKNNKDFENITVENKTLVCTWKVGSINRYDIIDSVFEVLKVASPFGPYGVGPKAYGSILFNIELESDAIRLKKALIHLGGLLKAEKSTDPFDN